MMPATHHEHLTNGVSFVIHVLLFNLKLDKFYICVTIVNKMNNLRHKSAYTDLESISDRKDNLSSLLHGTISGED